MHKVCNRSSMPNLENTWVQVPKNLLHKVGIREALLLCELVGLDRYWKKKKGECFDGWFTATHEFLFEQTAQNKNTQIRTIKVLVDKSVVEKRAIGFPQINQYRINYDHCLLNHLHQNGANEKTNNNEKPKEINSSTKIVPSKVPNKGNLTISTTKITRNDHAKAPLSYHQKYQNGAKEVPSWNFYTLYNKINNKINNSFILPSVECERDGNHQTIMETKQSKNGNGSIHSENEKEKTTLHSVSKKLISIQNTEIKKSPAPPETNPARSIGTRLTRGKASECFLGFGKLLSKVNDTPDLKGAQNFWKIAVPLGTFVVEQRIDESRVKTLISWLFDHYSDPFVPEFSNVHQFCKKFFQIEKAMNREGQERSNGSVKIHMAYGGVLTKNRDGSMKHDLIHSRDSEEYRAAKEFVERTAIKYDNSPRNEEARA